MNSVLIPAAERARNAQALVLSALQGPGSQVAIAAAMGVSEATVSRIKNERLEEVLAFLYAAGWKLVDAEKKCIAPEALEFMRKTTAHDLSDEAQARQLFEDES